MAQKSGWCLIPLKTNLGKYDQMGQLHCFLLAAHQQMGLDLAWILPETSPTIVSHCALDVDRRSTRKVYKAMVHLWTKVEEIGPIRS